MSTAGRDEEIVRRYIRGLRGARRHAASINPLAGNENLSKDFWDSADITVNHGNQRFYQWLFETMEKIMHTVAMTSSLIMKSIS
jgi:hypothetical protein